MGTTGDSKDRREAAEAESTTGSGSHGGSIVIGLVLVALLALIVLVQVLTG